MTNKEWMTTLTAEQFWEVMMWLIKDYGRRFTHTQLAVISWLDSEHKFGFGNYKSTECDTWKH